MEKPMENKTNSNLFLFIAMLFTTCLLVSNIASFKLTQIGDFQFTAAVFLFIITYIVNDVISEVYGYEKAKLVIWSGFALNLFVVLFFRITTALPDAEGFTGGEAYATVFANTPRMLIASLMAYLVGGFINAKILCKMKEKAEKYLFARCITSTLVGELMDSIIFITIGFAGLLPMRVLVSMILTETALKTAYEVVVYPVTKVVINKAKQVERC